MSKGWIKWEDWEKQVIKNYLLEEGVKGCHKRLPHRTLRAIQQQAFRLGIKGKQGQSLKDLTGKFFVDWEVLRRGENYVSPKGKHLAQWWVKCICGTEKLVIGNSLLSGKSTCCGKCPTIELGKIYNKYIEPIEFVKDFVNSSGRHQRAVKCICHYKGSECKGVFVTRVDDINSGKTGSCGCLHREKLKKGNPKPEGTHLTPLVTRYYTSVKYRELQNECFDRDNDCCIILGKLSRRLLTIHHTIPRNYYFKRDNITTWKQVLACKELWDLDNMVTISEVWHLGIKTDNPLALHKLYNGRTYKEEDYYMWLDDISTRGWYSKVC